jgi:hypothetical protein
MTQQAPGEGDASIVRYVPYSIEEFEHDAERARQVAGNAFMDLVVGDNVVRFVPPKLPGATPIRSTGMHFVQAIPGIDRTIAFACPAKELGQPCPVCAKVDEMRRSGNPVDREMGNKMAVTLAIYSNVIDRRAAADDPNGGLRVLRYGKSILEQLKTVRRNPRMGGDFFDPTPLGFDMVIVKEGEGMTTKYKVLPDRNPSPLAPDPVLAQQLIDNQHDLEQFVTPVVPDEILNALQMVRVAYGIPSRGPAPALVQAGVSPAQVVGAAPAWGAQRAAPPAPAAGAFGAWGKPAAAAAPAASAFPGWGGGAAPAPAVATPFGSALFGGSKRSAVADADFTEEQADVAAAADLAEAAAEAAEFDDDFGPAPKG